MAEEIALWLVVLHVPDLSDARVQSNGQMGATLVPGDRSDLIALVDFAQFFNCSIGGGVYIHCFVEADGQNVC